MQYLLHLFDNKFQLSPALTHTHTHPNTYKLLGNQIRLHKQHCVLLLLPRRRLMPLQWVAFPFHFHFQFHFIYIYCCCCHNFSACCWLLNYLVYVVVATEMLHAVPLHWFICLASHAASSICYCRTTARTTTRNFISILPAAIDDCHGSCRFCCSNGKFVNKKCVCLCACVCVNELYLCVRSQLPATNSFQLVNSKCGQVGCVRNKNWLTQLFAICLQFPVVIQIIHFLFNLFSPSFNFPFRFLHLRTLY